MNKIVCDVCGTSYPETTSQCPICGTAKTDTSKTTTGTPTGYAYVKGGRFSHANVKKRNAGKQELPRVVAPVKQQKKEPAFAKSAKADQNAEKAAKKQPAENRGSQNTGKNGPSVVLMLIAVFLVLAIIVACVLIVRQYIGNNNSAELNQNSTTPSSSQQTVSVPCTGLKLAKTEITFSSVGQSIRLEVTRSPVDCTESVTYESSAPEVAVVNEIGIVTAVARGEAIITIRCGNQSTQFAVVCDVDVEPVDPNNPTEPDPNGTTVPTQPPVVLELKKSELTLSGYGDDYNLYGGELDPSQITWTTSDENVATVENGIVVAVGNGDAVITAEYMGQTVTCHVHCEDVIVEDYILCNSYTRNVSDMTLKVGESVKLYLESKATGLTVSPSEVTYRFSKEGIITVDSKGRVKAVASGTVTVYVEYEGQTYKCTVRVKK